MGKSHCLETWGRNIVSSLPLEITIYLEVSFMCHIFLNDSSVKMYVTCISFREMTCDPFI